MFSPRSELLPPPGFQQPYPSAEWPQPAQSPVYLQPPPGFQPIRDPYVAPQIQRYPYHLIRLNQQPPQGHRPVQSWFRQSIPGYAYHLITTPSATGHQSRRPAYMDAPISMFTGPVVLPVAKVALKEFGTVTAVAERLEQLSEEVCDDEKVSPTEATEKALDTDAETILASSEQVRSPLLTACAMETTSKQEQSPQQTHAMKKVSDWDVDKNNASVEQVPSSSKKPNISVTEEQPLTESRLPNAESLKMPSIAEYAEENLHVCALKESTPTPVALQLPRADMTDRVTSASSDGLISQAVVSSSGSCVERATLPEPAFVLSAPRVHQDKQKLHRDQHHRVQLGGELPPWLSVVLCSVIAVTIFSLWYIAKNLIDITHCLHFAFYKIMFITSVCHCVSWLYFYVDCPQKFMLWIEMKTFLCTVLMFCLSYVYYDLLHAKFLILGLVICYLGIGGPGNFSLYIMDIMLCCIRFPCIMSLCL